MYLRHPCTVVNRGSLKLHPQTFQILTFQALKPMNIGVATGEACQNRVMFKQFLMSGGMQFCQVNKGMCNLSKHVPDVRRNVVLSGKYWNG